MPNDWRKLFIFIDRDDPFIRVDLTLVDDLDSTPTEKIVFTVFGEKLNGVRGEENGRR